MVEEASKKEIVRRYYNELNNYKMGLCDEDTYKKVKLLMNELKIDEYYLDVVDASLKKKEKENGTPVIALKIGKKMITGKQTELMTAPGSVVLNALKQLGKIPDIYLLSPKVLEPILQLKQEMGNEERLTLSEVLTALSICSVTNPVASNALSLLSKLRGAEAHATYIVTGNDKKALKDLKINLTCESEFIGE